MTSAALALTDVRCAGEDGVDPLAVSLTVQEGACVVLLGPVHSGAGTVLRLCAGLLAPDEGLVRVCGQDPAALEDDGDLDFRLRVGVVLQPPGLLSNMTVFNNVALPLRFHQAQGESEIDATVTTLLTQLGVASLRDRFPAALTFGEAKSVALARALVMGPTVLLLEEPDAGLDAEEIGRCRALLEDRRRRRPLTLLMTLSHASPLQSLADRVVYLREGQVVAEGPRPNLLSAATGDLLAYLGA